MRISFVICSLGEPSEDAEAEHRFWRIDGHIRHKKSVHVHQEVSEIVYDEQGDLGGQRSARIWGS